MPVRAEVVVRAGIIAVEVQVPRMGAGVLRTGPVDAVFATVVQRAVVVAVPGSRQHQVTTKKPGTAIISAAG